MFLLGRLRRKAAPKPPPVNERTSYQQLVDTMLRRHKRQDALDLAVGGDFDSMGPQIADLLIRIGLQEHHYLIDVGCGSGRMSLALAKSPIGASLRYLGLDIVPDLLKAARERCRMPNWRFEHAAGLKIPEKDERADMVCFFSVLTHLLQEESFLYLVEAKRVLKRGGKLVFSYLNIADPAHWHVLESGCKQIEAGLSLPCNVFLSHDFIRVWAEKLNLRVVHIGMTDCGQHTCVLEK